MSKRKTKRKPRLRQNYWLIGGALIAATGLLYPVWANTRPKPEAFVSGSPGELLRLPTPAGRDRSTTFGVPDHLGERAPAFTAIEVDGQAYSVAPGDGRAKALIFYMGFQ